MLSVTLGILLIAAPRSYAHAELLDTSPANGEHVDAPPSRIVLRFTEHVSPVPGAVVLRDSDGQALGNDEARSVPGHPDRVALAMPAALGDGVYTVSWRVVSADAHPVSGAFVFSVGTAQATGLADPAAGGGVDSTVNAVFWAFRLLGYAALALLVGGLFFVTVCWPPGRGDPRARRLVRVGWVSGLACGVAVLLLQGPYVAGVSLAHVLDPELLGGTLGTPYGAFVVGRLVLLGLAGALLVWLGRTAGRQLNPPQLAGISVLAVALPATWPGTGHAATGPLLAYVADTVHLIAMSVWLGGLALLFACVLPLRGDGATFPSVSEVAGLLPRFSRTAMAAVAVLVVTGVYQALAEVGTFGDLAGGRYGQLLAFKLAAFGLLLWLGAASRSAVARRYLMPAVHGDGAEEQQPRHPVRTAKRTRRTEQARDRVVLTRLRASVAVEALIAVGVLGITAGLVATPPGGEHLHGAGAGAGPVR
ncbi:MAG: copper resistance CopC/CopD family protein, partial [Carbonactinosporaceae bacterium]